MTALAVQVTAFAALFTPERTNAEQLTAWITRTGLPTCPFYALSRTIWSATAPQSTPPSSCSTTPARTEGANTKIKLLERLTYGRAGHGLLHQLVLRI
ncbi:hypothetical protein GCM10010372_50790 [Streptomyces tauricus]|uniref:hypothetical protein n=1 Tax=Streptomyces tauricus TaxID=68274 RepID=UPI00167A72D9|nr:hypothetical protein [Streptomyces tauricus]GHA44725.1 hypothetical protein GCM10010372_50790 [Streptomyces tauricus]